MIEEVILRELAAVNAIVTNTHVVYTSGRHGSAYVNKDAIYLHPRVISALCYTMGKMYDTPDRIDTVAGPTIGGVILSQWMASHLTHRRMKGETVAVFAEEDGDGDQKRRVFKRGYDHYVTDRNVVVVEDILTTGGSARKVIEAVRELGGRVIGLSVLCNRGGITAKDVGDVPVYALTSIPLESWAEDECPLCQAHIPINTTVGKGTAFLARNNQSSMKG